MKNNANFYHLCAQQFQLDDPFLIDPISERQYTYRDLDSQTSLCGNYLNSLGLKKGQRVMVQVEKSPQNLFWYFACLRLGLIYLPLNTAYTAGEVSYFVENAEPSLIICDPTLSANFETATCPVKTLDGQGRFSESLDKPQSLTSIHCDLDDVAVILYTSGTTGKPKGAMISHGNLSSNVSALTETWQFSRDDVLLHGLPIFHIHGLFVATHLCVSNGATIRFLPSFDPEKIIQQLPNSTVYMGVPTHYVRLLARPEFNTTSCSNMRLFTSGSAPLLPQTFSAMTKQTGHRIVERYGMTETGMNTSNPLDGARKPGTVGLPLSGVSARVVDENNNLVNRGAPGTLLIKGSNVFRGYWRMPEKTKEEFTSDGYFITGDIASVDTDGYISIIGRDKDMIISGGLNVYPKEIENVIDRLAGVNESAVIGRADSDFGEAVIAIIVADGTASLDEESIRVQLKQVLANFKVPKRVYFIDQLPRNTMGKVQKNILREKFSD